MCDKRLVAIQMVLVLASLCATPGASRAAEFFLRADTMTKTMPDATEVTMWGFALDSAFDAEDGDVTVPGPTLVVPPGDSTLTIHLDNNLPEPVSIVVPGLVTAMVPVFHDLGPYAGRVRSFTHETPPGNATAVDYTWPNVTPGTRMYQTGTHQAVQVQMGLYGALKKDFASMEAYPGVSYDKDILLLYSEIDPAIHEAVATGNYGPGMAVTSTVDYKPAYFLVNGTPFTEGTPPVSTANPGGTTLIRFINAGIESHSPVLQGKHMTLIAEDGNPYTYPRSQYAVLLPAAKTIDATVTFEHDGTYAVYDRMLRLTNARYSPGGLFTELRLPSLRLRTTQFVWSDDGTAVTITFEPSQPARAYYYRLFETQLGYTRTTENSATITGLGDGTYLFIVTAKDANGVFAPEPARVSFINKPVGAEYQVFVKSVSIDHDDVDVQVSSNLPSRRFYARLFDTDPGYVTNTTGAYSYTGLSEGIHYLVATGKDTPTGAFPTAGPARQWIEIVTSGF